MPRPWRKGPISSLATGISKGWQMSGSRRSWPDDRRDSAGLYLGDRPAQFDGERAEPVAAAAAVAGFAGLFDGGGGAAERVGADRLGRTLQPMRREGEAGEVAGA